MPTQKQTSKNREQNPNLNISGVYLPEENTEPSLCNWDSHVIQWKNVRIFVQEIKLLHHPLWYVIRLLAFYYKTEL